MFPQWPLPCSFLSWPGRFLKKSRCVTSPVRLWALFCWASPANCLLSTIHCIALLASLVLLAWYILEQRRFSLVLFFHTAGCVLGTALLFLSPAYRAIGNEDNAYTMERGLHGFLNTARENLPDMLQSLIETSPVLYLSLAALCLFFFFSLRKKRWSDVLLAAVITAAALWYLAGQLLGGPVPTLKLRLLIALIWGFTLLLSCLLWVPEGLQRRRAVFFLLSAAAAAAPLAVVSPIGPRCLFLSYVLLLLTAGNLLQAALADVQRPARAATGRSRRARRRRLGLLPADLFPHPPG